MIHFVKSLFREGVLPMIREWNTLRAAAVNAALLLATVVLLTSCASQGQLIADAREKTQRGRYDEAKKILRKTDSDPGRSLLSEIRKSEAILEQVQTGDDEYRVGRKEGAIQSYGEALDMDERLFYKSFNLREALERARDRVGSYYLGQFREWDEDAEYGKIIETRDEALEHLNAAHREYTLIENLVENARKTLDKAHGLKEQGDRLYSQQNYREAIDLWREAKRVAPELASNLDNLIYRAEQRIETEVLDEFNGLERTGIKQYKGGEYKEAIETLDEALDLRQAHTGIVLDDGSIRRFRRLAEKALKEVVGDGVIDPTTIDEMYGFPLVPAVIDYSQDDKITAVGEGQLDQGDTDRWRAEIFVPEKQFYNLYCEVDQGYETRVYERHDTDDPYDNLVTGTFTDQGRINYICHGVAEGVFFSRVTNLTGGETYRLEATLYREIDK